MNSVFSSQSLFVPLVGFQFLPCLQTQPQPLLINRVYRQNHCAFSLSVSFPCTSRRSLHACRSSFGATAPSNEGVVSVINFDDFAEKDWSFLDSGDFSSDQDYNLNIDRIISAGEIEETSRVMVSIASEGFVDRLVESSPCSLLHVVHDSLFVLAGIKEKYDKVKCWQLELVYVPHKWVPLDVCSFIAFQPCPGNLTKCLKHLQGVLHQVRDWLLAIPEEEKFWSSNDDSIQML